jgi:4-hydroxy-tetrahydrodipicolinate reductase
MGSLIAQLLKNEYSHVAHLAASMGRNDPPEHLLKTDVIIDVSTPSAMASLATWALSSSSKLPSFVVGSTGWSPPAFKLLEQLANRTPTLISSNFSVGIYALTTLLETYSPLLRRLGYAPVITEKHHSYKKDAPSGTALSLQKAIDPSSPNPIPIHSIRAGEIVGEHEVTFFSSGDRLTFSHQAQDRSIFARGAIDVAVWLAQKPHSTGNLLGMNDYFNSLRPLR